MSKRVPPKAGYWMDCLCCVAVNGDHTNCKDFSLYETHGTLKGFHYIHCMWGTHWTPLLWTCFPWKEMKTGKSECPNGKFIYFATFADLEKALGSNPKKSFIYNR